MIKHILFDLDGTLLPMSQDKFVECYMTLLSRYFIPHNIKPEALTSAIWKGVGAMVQNNGEHTNEEVFWNCFTKLIPIEREKMEPLLLDFYNNDFNQVIKVTRPTTHAAELIHTLKGAGLKLYLATNPIFPQCATYNRMRWAGLSPEAFEEITTYESYHYSKPNVLYFKELIERFQLNPKECLMIGNDVEEDMSIQRLGVKVCLVTDCLENKNNLPLMADYKISLKELAAKASGTGYF
ncbi:HAD family hydrolase [Lachnospiraceae bacterium 42-17]